MHPMMSSKECEPLFLSNDDDEVDINVVRVREQLVAAEKLQQEHMEQKRVEREWHWAEAEAERIQ